MGGGVFVGNEEGVVVDVVCPQPIITAVKIMLKSSKRIGLYFTFLTSLSF
jgi:hypothetical protein